MPTRDEGSCDAPAMIDDTGQKHPLLIWTSLRPGDIVALVSHTKQKLMGTVETGTEDGLIIWIRTELNERKLLHFHDCEHVQVIRHIDKDRDCPRFC